MIIMNEVTMYNIVDKIMDELPTDSSGKWVSFQDIRSVLENNLLPKLELHDTTIHALNDYRERKKNWE